MTRAPGRFSELSGAFLRTVRDASTGVPRFPSRPHLGRVKVRGGRKRLGASWGCRSGVGEFPAKSAELEFVEITIIVVVVMVMVVVITCLLSHYKLSARSFLGRHSQGRRREDALSSEGCLWPSESTVSGSGVPEPQVYAPPRPADRLAVPPFAQRDRFHRFQPTYPYLQHEIDLPPTISLSDGEEPPPYQGPCTLQLRDPEQQLELNRESVRAPPNRTIFDSDLMDSAMLGGPCPPSSNSGISATCYGGGGRMEGPPPTYSEVIGHYPGASTFQHQQTSGPPSLLEGTRLHPAHIAPLESTAAWGKEKDKQKGHPL
ncbi:protein TMEPAI isoform X1 [Sus scrofa]|uniref:Prostate transmembrane protein, androgen induced 1 n=1 Tax=Sus scrofa TaxID=9823 RepID=A0A8D1C8F5_PIG|nr:protein TMEPAI isoform X1 [Sus scrofa]